MSWIYLSPHLDDVALSCGGLVWEQAQLGEGVSIWTICAGEPPAVGLSPFARQLHERWKLDQNAPAERRMEDFRSCQRLGASPHYISIPDCIYRRDPSTGDFLYTSEASLNGQLHPADLRIIQTLQTEIRHSIDADAVLVCPLGLGNHVDHQLTRRVAEGMAQDIWYYADFPYVLKDKSPLDQMERDGWIKQLFPISAGGLAAWTDSISAHASQISTFWENDLAMRLAVADYLHCNEGIPLWKKSDA
jgi:LmbE family N-acetylglucosaminyl deacetylase